MTSEEFVYADTANLFGSDVQPPEIEALLRRLHALHHPASAVRPLSLPDLQQPTAERAA
ncbi:hypothetical protein [Streptomyces sp. NPDC000410]|uniref:hypothetical protein n=1 Tax=Streptomyces sp. NPDC000410 TaxID=3154254 RepID=UPI00331B7FE5